MTGTSSVCALESTWLKLSKKGCMKVLHITLPLTVTCSQQCKQLKTLKLYNPTQQILKEIIMMSVTKESTFKKNMKRHKKISGVLTGLGFEMSAQCVIDNTLPKYCFRVVCESKTLIYCDNKEDFLRKNPVIKNWMDSRKSMIEKYNLKQQEAHEWSNRPVVRIL
jgi:hypothetical protein